MPLSGLQVRRGDGLGGVKEFLRLLGRLFRHLRREPEIAVRFSHVQFGVLKHSIAARGCEPANVIGMKGREQDQIDLTRGVARASEIRYAISERGRTVLPPGRGVAAD